MSDFATTATVLEPLQFHSSTLLPDGRVLVAGGRVGTDSPTFTFDPMRGRFGSAGVAPLERRLHTGTLLTDGRVLFAGGVPENDTNAGPLATSTLYDPLVRSFAEGPALAVAMKGQTATRLLSGEVLLAAEGAAQLFDPTSNKVVGPFAMVDAKRHRAAAVRLASGRVLFVGGNSDGKQQAELFDPKTQTFTATGATVVARTCSSAILLPEVASLPKPKQQYALVLGGGCIAADVDSAELFDESTGTFSLLAAKMSSPRSEVGLSLLPSDVVVALGGQGDLGVRGDAEVLDLATMTFTLATSMPPPPQRIDHTDTVLSTGEDLVLGGSTKGVKLPAATFSTPRDVIATLSPLAPVRDGGVAVRLEDGRVLFVGGSDASGAVLSTTEVFDPISLKIKAGPSIGLGTLLPTATLLDDGRVLVAGGDQGAQVGLADATLLDFRSNEAGVAKSIALPSPRGGHAAALLPSGEVLLVGGFDANSAVLATALLFDPKTDAFTKLDASLLVPSDYVKATPLLNGDVLVVGGDTVVAQRFDVKARAFVAVKGSLSEARHPVALVLLPSGEVLVAGRRDESGVGIESTLDLYDPDSDSFSALPSPPTGHLLGATLLPSGRVLLAGDNANGALFTFSPSTRTFELAASLGCVAIDVLAFALSPTGEVVLNGCHDTMQGLQGARLWTEFPASKQRAPSLSSLAPALDGGATIDVMGARLTGVSEGSNGRTSASPSDVPIGVWMPNGRGGAFVGGLSAFTDSTAKYRAPVTPLAGSGLLFVSANGLAGSAAPLRVAAAANGTSCGSAFDCASRACVDGVCCDTACTSVCEACVASKKGAGKDGICGPIAAGADPDDECDQQPAATCGQSGSCDGAGRCANYPDDTACASAGHCKSGACIGATCASNVDCPSGELCTSAGLCAPLDVVPGAPSSIGGCTSSNVPSDASGSILVAVALLARRRRRARVVS